MELNSSQYWGWHYNRALVVLGKRYPNQCPNIKKHAKEYADQKLREAKKEI